MAARVYQLLCPHADLPMVGSLGVTCFGSAHQALGVASLTSRQPDRAIHHLHAAASPFARCHRAGRKWRLAGRDWLVAQLASRDGGRKIGQQNHAAQEAGQGRRREGPRAGGGGRLSRLAWSRANLVIVRLGR